MATNDSECNQIDVPKSDIKRYNEIDKKGKRKCSTTDHEKKFTSVTELNSSSTCELTMFCKSLNILELVQSLCELSVMITVNYVSEARKAFTPPDCIKTIYENPPKSQTCSGTILRIIDADTFKGYVEILTARHVIFDSVEAENSKCLLYFDDMLRENETGIGTELSQVYHEDWCKLICKMDLKARDNIQINLQKFGVNFENIKKLQEKRKKKIIIISHPHGCHTYISMGELKLKQDFYIVYDTPACFGSSGGCVLPIGYKGGLYIHSGVGTTNNGFSSGMVRL